MKGFVGIDACKSGWVIAVFEGEILSLNLIKSLADAQGFFVSASMIGIDMPIGLSSSSHARECDIQLKAMLAPEYRSSVFYPPIRQAIEAKTYQEGCQVQFELTGKKFSKQSWNIAPKIREVDQFLRQNTSFQCKAVEMHPELCFKKLNGDVHPLHKKKTPEGFSERMAIMGKYHQQAVEMITEFVSATKKKEALPDDVADAVAIALALKMGYPNRLRSIPAAELKDVHGLRMQVVYPEPGSI